MIKKNNIYILAFIIFLTSCQSVKDGLSGRKSENSDEFLVQKKNPLVLPPDFTKLPKPNNDLEENDEINRIEEETDIKKILQNNSQKTNKQTNNSNAEEFVLKNIK